MCWVFILSACKTARIPRFIPFLCKFWVFFLFICRFSYYVYHFATLIHQLMKTCIFTRLWSLSRETTVEKNISKKKSVLHEYTSISLLFFYLIYLLTAVVRSQYVTLAIIYDVQTIWVNGENVSRARGDQQQNIEEKRKKKCFLQNIEWNTIEYINIEVRIQNTEGGGLFMSIVVLHNYLYRMLYTLHLHTEVYTYCFTVIHLQGFSARYTVRRIEDRRKFPSCRLSTVDTDTDQLTHRVISKTTTK